MLPVPSCLQVFDIEGSCPNLTQEMGLSSLFHYHNFFVYERIDNGALNAKVAVIEVRTCPTGSLFFLTRTIRGCCSRDLGLYFTLYSMPRRMNFHYSRELE